jgi:hypothetical protein
MNNGKNLGDLLTALKAKAFDNRDYVVPENRFKAMAVGEGSNQKLVFDVPGHGFFSPTDHATQQVGAHYGIPARYVRKLESSPELLADNINHWRALSEGTRLFRVNRNDLRAFLSDRYKIIDHLPVLTAALEGVHDTKAVPLASDVTETRMYLKFLFPEIKGEVRPGDTVSPGVCITNSEIGGGSFRVKGFFFRDFCTNGCVFGSGDLVEEVSRRHLGSKMSTGLVVRSAATDAAESELMASQTRDILQAVSDEKIFGKMLERLQATTTTGDIQNPEKAVEVVAERFGLSEAERAEALVNLIQDRDYTQYGVTNAITKIANNTESQDRVFELENVGAQLLDLSMRQFETIRVAA